MTTLDASDRAATSASERGLGRRSLATAIPASLAFGTTIGLSAFLLFSVEPLIGRLVLPVFGGAGGVWATVLAFFQGVLLLGYLYAHLSATRRSVRTGATLHLVLAVIALAATATAPQRVASLRFDGVPTLLNLIAMLAVIIGPAAFVLTATTPLMSSWYARVRRAADASASEADPYWLYALSNGGSFVALLAYPFIVEQTIGLSAQRAVWFGGFIVLVVALTVAAVKYASTVSTLRTDTVAAAVRTTLTRDRRLRWLLLSAVPAGLLSAVTNFVTTDLISAPLLWVVPLAVYLASFVVAFSASGRARIVPIAIALAPVVVTLMWVPLGSAAGWPIVPLLVIEYLGLGILAVALHGRLATDRPAADHLTDFYLTMSIGGVIGGTFVAVIAPLAFDGVWEYPLLLVAAAVALAIRLEGGAASAATTAARPLRRLLSGSPMRLLPFGIVAAVLVWSMAADKSLAFEAGWRWLALGALVLLVGGVRWFFAGATALILILATFILPPAPVFRDRSFFGVVEVLRTKDATVLMHGTTVHGVEWYDRSAHPDPGTYYSAFGPAGDAFRILAAADPAGADIRVVGLGAGSLAWYTHAGDRMTFYEIDPLVAQVAADTRYFDYLASAKGAVDVRIGDGRLLLEADAPSSVDLVVLDAFSSDAVPVHLITQEAIGDAFWALRPDGMLTVHVSNRYYDLAPAIAAAAARLGVPVLEREFEPTEAQHAAGAGLSDWMVLTRSPQRIADFRAAGWAEPRTADHPLTDDFSDLLRHLRPGAW
jgi:SAM-dependent methyltransferase